MALQNEGILSVWVDNQVMYQEKQAREAAHLERLYRQVDTIYAERDTLVSLVQRLCLLIATLVPGSEIDAGMGRDTSREAQEGWEHIAYVNLPSGQCSWHIHDSELPYFEHIPKYDHPWDGHTTEEKYQRVLHPQLETITNTLFPIEPKTHLHEEIAQTFATVALPTPGFEYGEETLAS